jgi:hypothetical protein
LFFSVLNKEWEKREEGKWRKELPGTYFASHAFAHMHTNAQGKRSAGREEMHRRCWPSLLSSFEIIFGAAEQKNFESENGREKRTIREKKENCIYCFLCSREY